ncbi:MAG: porin [bacterium]|nr:porin [bacterium]
MFKKLLLTLSTLTLLMASSAFAGDQAWTMYGVAHASVNSLSNGNDSQLGVSSNTSRFGFKGTSPLNDEFTAFWQFESTLDLTGSFKSTESITTTTYRLEDDPEAPGESILVPVTNTQTITHSGTTLSTRNSFVGVKHKDAGSLLIGRHDTPFKSLGRKVEMFPDQLADFRMLTNNTHNNEKEKWDRRLTEIVAWKSPEWSGFGVFAAYQFDQADLGAAEAKTAISAMVSYTRDEFMVGVGYEAMSAGSGDKTTVNNVDKYADGPMAMRVAAKYTGEQFDLGALFQSATEQDWTGTAPDFVIDEWTYTVLGAGATFHVNDKWDVKGAFFVKDARTDAKDDLATAAYDESDTKATMMAFGVERIFGKNVRLYAQYASVSNGDATNITLAGADTGFGTGVNGVNGASIAGTGANPSTNDNPFGVSIGTVVSW